MLKPGAIAVLLLLEQARGRAMSSRQIAKKMGEESVISLLCDMRDLGLVRRADNYYSIWCLNTQIAARPFANEAVEYEK